MQVSSQIPHLDCSFFFSSCSCLSSNPPSPRQFLATCQNPRPTLSVPYLTPLLEFINKTIAPWQFHISRYTQALAPLELPSLCQLTLTLDLGIFFLDYLIFPHIKYYTLSHLVKCLPMYPRSCYLGLSITFLPSSSISVLDDELWECSPYLVYGFPGSIR